MNINKKTINKTLFLDIETVSEKKDYAELSEAFQKLWSKKALSFQKGISNNDDNAVSALYEEKAGIFAEFSKIVCISVAYLHHDGKLRVKSFSGDEEKPVLLAFCDLLTGYYNDTEKHFLCGHNIKEFDIPFICRRLAKHSMPLPSLLNLSGKKPWQTDYLIDTMDLWRFGDIKNYTSLELIATTLGIPTPKDDIDGSQVGRVYWKENNLERIVAYCQKDVVTVVRVLQHLSNQDITADEEIEWIA